MTTTIPTTLDLSTPVRRSWSGPINGATVDIVAERLVALLTGNSYTFISAYEYAGWRPEVRIRQRLVARHDTPSIRVTKRDGIRSVIVSDTYGVWGVDDIGAKPTWVSFDGLRDEVLVKFTTPAGLGAWWLIKVEGDLPESED